MALRNWFSDGKLSFNHLNGSFHDKFLSFLCLNIYTLLANLQFLWVPFKRFLLYPAGRSNRAREQVQFTVSIKPGQLTLMSCDLGTGGELLWSTRGVVNHFRIDWNKIIHPEWLCSWGLFVTNLTRYVLSRGKLPCLHPMAFFIIC